MFHMLLSLCDLYSSPSAASQSLLWTCTRACFIDVGSDGSSNLVAAGVSTMAVAKQRASVVETCGLCSAIATACLYDGLRVCLPCRILRLSTDAEMLRC
jgi:hypothetical protein